LSNNSQPNCLYRYHESLYSEYGLMLILSSFPVLSKTRCGYQIDVYGKKRFVNLEANKKYACVTKEEALESYHARKRRQIRILKHALAKAEAALLLTESSGLEYFDGSNWLREDVK
jgi:hypothetical protein